MGSESSVSWSPGPFVTCSFQIVEPVYVWSAQGYHLNWAGSVAYTKMRLTGIDVLPTTVKYTILLLVLIRRHAHRIVTIGVKSIFHCAFKGRGFFEVNYKRLESILERPYR